MNRDAAVRLVNSWIDDFRLYLKDGGGAAGVHARAKEALIQRIAEVLDAKPVIVVAEVDHDGPPPVRRGRGRPRKGAEVV